MSRSSHSATSVESADQKQEEKQAPDKESSTLLATLNQQAKIEFLQGNYRRALDYYLKALDCPGLTVQNIAICHHNLASCYRHLKEYEKAYRYYVQAQLYHSAGQRNKEENHIHEMVKLVLSDDSIEIIFKIKLIQDEILRYGTRKFADSKEAPVKPQTRAEIFEQAFSKTLSDAFFFSKKVVYNPEEVLQDAYIKYLHTEGENLLALARLKIAEMM